MPGKGRQTPRKPATKFAHLRKKMEKNRIMSKISKRRKRIAARSVRGDRCRASGAYNSG